MPATNYSIHLLHHTRLTIGQNIHARRVRQRMTLVKLSRLSGVPERMIDQFELGKCDIRLEDMLRLAGALRVEFQALVVS